MSMVVEAVLHLSVIAISLIATLLYTFMKINKTRDSKDILFKSTGLNFLIFAAGSLMWSIVASDGLSALFGVVYYGYAFIAIAIINRIILALIEKFKRHS